MIKTTLLLACLASALGAGALRLGAAEDDHRRWLAERYAEAVSVRPGMSRRDLRRLFRPDGGLQTIPSGRYVLKSCPLIKVEVKFALPEGASPTDSRDENEGIDARLEITEVSKLYLEPEAAD
jgi:hypothetical protein